jgi:hypothetical protein
MAVAHCMHCIKRLKPTTDEHVFYDKFLCDKFYLPSARVYMQQILYDKFPYDKFYLLVWTCQKKVFIAAMTEKNLIVRWPITSTECSNYLDKFSLLTHTIAYRREDGSETH